jgi:hypothetical protein
MQTAVHVQMAGYTVLPAYNVSTTPAPPHRRKRAVTQDVYVDVVALTDYGVYKA